MQILRILIVLAVVLVTFSFARGDYRSDYYSNPNEIVVEHNGVIVDRLSCQRIPLSYPEQMARGEAHVARDSNGDIWVAMGYGFARGGRGVARLFHSSDDGITWDSRLMPPTYNRMVTGFTILNDDTMLLAGMWFTWCTVPNPVYDSEDRPANIYRSIDLGVNWTEVHRLLPGEGNPPPDYKWMVDGTLSMTTLSDGRVLLPSCRWTDGDVENYRLQGYIYVSTDGGSSFPAANSIPTFVTVSEAHILELQSGSGKLLGAFRYQRWRLPGETDAEILAMGGDPTNDVGDPGSIVFKNLFVGDSDDGGLTWHDLRPLKDHQGQALLGFGEAHGQLVQVPDGRAILVHDHRYPSEEGDNRARVSWDEGQTWEPERYYLSYGSGYPSSVALEDGTIVTVTGYQSSYTGPYMSQVIRWAPRPKNQLDTDGDGIPGLRDNCPNDYNPGQEDVEEINAGRQADGIGDVCDNCPTYYNPTQADCDSDGTGDVCAIATGASEDCTGNGIPDECEPDADGDGVPNDCDLCPGTPPGWAVDEDGCTLSPLAPCDFDGDLDVDQEDFGHLQVCLTGSDISQTDPDCQNARLDGDTDVDGDDLTVFLKCMSGPSVMGDNHYAD